MKKWRKFLILLMLVFGFLFDKVITRFIVENRNILLNNFMMWFGMIGSVIFVFIIMTTLFLWKENKRKYIPVLWFSIGLAYLSALIIKNIVARARPELSPLIETFTGYGFPSGHATAVFSTIAILRKEFRKISLFWIIIALLVCFSRVYLGVHYLSDVLAGALLGYFISLISLELEEKYEFSEKIFQVLKKKKRKRKK